MELKELIEKAQQGDEFAFQELYDLTYQKAFIEAMSFMKNEDRASEALQLAYIKIANNIQKIDDYKTFYKWVNTIVANTCRDQLRKRNEFTFSDYDGNDDDDLSMEVEDETRAYKPDENAKYEDDRDVVIGFINELPTEQRTALIMQVYDEMKISEIAEFFGTSENTIKSRLNYAKKSLKQKIIDYKKGGNTLFASTVIFNLKGYIDSYETTIHVDKDVYANISHEVQNVLAKVASPKTEAIKATQKVAQETSKNATEQTTSKVTQETTQKVSEDATKKATEQSTKIAEETSKNATEQTTSKVTQETTKEVTEDATKKATEQSTKIAEETGKNATEQTTSKIAQETTKEVIQEVVEETAENESRKSLIGMFIDLPAKVKFAAAIVILLLMGGGIVLMGSNDDNEEPVEDTQVLNIAYLDELDSTYIQYLLDSLTYDGSDTSFYTNFTNNVINDGDLLSLDTIKAIKETGNNDELYFSDITKCEDDQNDAYILASIGYVENTETVELQEMPEMDSDVAITTTDVSDEYRVYVKSDDFTYCDVLIKREYDSFFGYTVLEYTVDNQKMTFKDYSPYIIHSLSDITAVTSGDEACEYVIDNDYDISYDEIVNFETDHTVDLIDENDTATYGYYYLVEVGWEGGDIYRYYVFSETGKTICLTDIDNYDDGSQEVSVDSEFNDVNVVVSGY